MISAAGLELIVLVSLGISIIAPVVLIYLVIKDMKGRKLW